MQKRQVVIGDDKRERRRVSEEMLRLIFLHTSPITYFLYHINIQVYLRNLSSNDLLDLTFLDSCSSPYRSPSAVGGQPGT